MKKIKTEKELYKALDKINWDELHRMRISYDSGYEIWMYWDGTKVHLSIESQNTIAGPENAVFASFPCDLCVDHWYSDDWAEEVTDMESLDYGKYVTEDGRIIDENTMINESIRDGEWHDLYNHWTEEIIQDWWDEQRNSHAR